MKTQKKSVKSKEAICKSIASEQDSNKKKSRKIKVAIASIAASTALLLGGGFALSTVIGAKNNSYNSDSSVAVDVGNDLLKLSDEQKIVLNNVDSYNFDANESIVSFGAKKTNKLKNLRDVDVSETIKNLDITTGFDSWFDTNALQLHYTIVLSINSNDIIKETHVSDAIILDNGEIDFKIEISGASILFSEYKNEKNTRGWFGDLFNNIGNAIKDGINDIVDGINNIVDDIKNIVEKVIDGITHYLVEGVEYVILGPLGKIVLDTAEKIRMIQNYAYNQDLEKQGKGVYSNQLIDNQGKNIDGQNSADYRFGFTKFAEVGCEVASVYNLFIKLNKTEMLSDVILQFENLGIEFDFGFGFLGSDPLSIYKILDKHNVSYTSYVDYSSFKLLADNSAIGSKFVMSRINEPVSEGGIHTVYLEKLSNGYMVYNLYSWKNENGNRTIYNLEDIRENGFIVGYLINA